MSLILTHFRSNIGKASASEVIMRCGWKGGIINGHCFDHFVPSATSETKSFTNDANDQISKFLTDADLDEWKKKSKEASNAAIADFKEDVVESTKIESSVLLGDNETLGFKIVDGSPTDSQVSSAPTISLISATTLST